jgi:succinate dehydrogenase cytochrome b subunit
MLARVHSLLGVVPLGAFLVLHLYDNWPALSGREPWVDRQLHVMSRPWAVALVLVPLGLHALLGAVRFARARRDPRPDPGAGLGKLQAATGALVLGFVIYHVVQVWSVDAGPEHGPRAVYALLWQGLGTPLGLGVYLGGVTLVCFHLGLGLSRAPRQLGWRPGLRGAGYTRLAAGALGFVLWAMWLQLLAHFALGQPLLGGG